ncbi:MAG: hypothetical protein FWH18_07735 [Marinilabiliaceae bacterium]|nr:hypothetical protein [Marinilabiliaceae bacterium]
MLSTKLLFSQNYIEYSKIKWKAVDCIIDDKFHESQIYFDSLYNNYDFIFAGDCFYALKVAILNNDSVGASKYLLKGISMGLPVESIKKDIFINKNLNFDLWQNINREIIDSLLEIYYGRINNDLLQKIIPMFELDQKVTNQVNKSFLYYFKWRRVTKINAKIVKGMINEYGFPGEKIVGVSENIGDIERYIPNRYETFYMLVHYFSNYEKDWDEYNQLLYNQLENGNLTPYAYGFFCDFRAKWKRNKRKGFEFIYNVWDPYLNETKTEEINNRRESIGLLDVDFEKKKREHNLNIHKNRLYDSKIFLELLL